VTKQELRATSRLWQKEPQHCKPNGLGGRRCDESALSGL